MAVCEFVETCPFFTAASGYSPEMFEEMRRSWCLAARPDCARKWARRYVALEQIPDDLLPTDATRAHDLVLRLTGRDEEPS
ncbi:MAG: hypothetical protein FDZ70_03030 [Actinobacteria bacterium]|nr:MAG: hypothetical protein FDZ70_03030 [Actinomycetota bacterium]